MKNLLLSTAILSATALGAYAQDAEVTADASSDMSSSMFLTQMDPMELQATNLIGMRLYAQDADMDADSIDGVQDNWNDIGEIGDVILDRDGAVDAVLLDIGGFLGLGERQVAIRMDQLDFVADDSTEENPNDFFLVVNAPQSALENAPEYQMSNDMDTAMDDTMTDDATMTAPMADDTMTADADMQATAPMDQDPNLTAEAQSDMATPEMTTDMSADATMQADMSMSDGYTQIESAEITADALTGASVYGPNDEDLGEVSDLVLTADGTVDEAVIDVGGFLGLGEKPVALAMDDLDVMQENDGDTLRVFVSMTEEQLKALPAYEK
ncbi:PRC-barrel domain protein [Aquimixticola soesokkakensis]|uniref:PRC-barrel domain protein n=1 Tax=Aquimixticola soesokkakensis TaxID=1519096 RepID=A0A1Y5TCX5_9RHOB|nr:PRC-barrel domain-containing protein [Aquimixticola soesokkakensis]SLN60852.1 PRC-barrel domain protein [Aquimixticola soesokkakensis]